MGAHLVDSGAASGWLHAGRTRREALRIAVRAVVRSLVLDLHGAASERHTLSWAG
jgi:hypothetical protein